MAKQTDEMRYTECFVAFIDVLGFGDAVRRSVDEPELLKKLARATNFMADMPSGTKTSRRDNGDGTVTEREWRVQTRAFSDTVVTFMPTETGSISQMLFMVRYLHDRMLELKLCMRGAVTIGGMYWNDAWSNGRSDQRRDQSKIPYQRGGWEFPVTLGPGLIEAYRLESECAIYPRILISDSLHQYFTNKQIECTPFGPYQPPDRLLTDFIRTDADGLRFLDLLHPEIMRNDTERIVRQPASDGKFSITWERDGGTHQRVMRNVHALIDEAVAHACHPEKIRAKYEWLRTYAGIHAALPTPLGGA